MKEARMSDTLSADELATMQRLAEGALNEEYDAMLGFADAANPATLLRLLAQVREAEARWEALKADVASLHGPALRLSEQEKDDMAVLWRGKAIAYETVLGAMSRPEHEHPSTRDPWQDTETAPKDKPVLTLRRGGLMAVAENIPDGMGKGGHEWCCTDGVFLLNVTHWQPLPLPPAREGSEG